MTNNNRQLNNKITKTFIAFLAVLLFMTFLPIGVIAEEGSVDITAVVKHKRSVNVLTPEHGQIIVVAPLEIYEGDEISFTVTPDDGYILKNLSYYIDDPSDLTDITSSKRLDMPDADITVVSEFVELCTISFDMQGHGSQISPITNVVPGSIINAPISPTSFGYSFGGWYIDKEYTSAFNFGSDKINSSIVLYAKWIKNDVDSSIISGNVKENDQNVPNAKVELYLGTIKLAATTTDINGTYSFDKVENGTYNIVVTKQDGKTKTELIEIDVVDSFTLNVEFPSSNVNSFVDINDSAVISDNKTIYYQIVAGGVDKVAEKYAIDDNTVTVTLFVEPKKDEGTIEQVAIKSMAGDEKIVEFLDLSLLMQINQETPMDIGDDNDTLLTIVIPFDFVDVKIDSVTILRYHDSPKELRTTPNKNGEYFKIDKENETITLYAMKFSEYALAYEKYAPNDPDRPHYIIPMTGVFGENGNGLLFKISSLSLLAVGTYLVIRKKKDN